MNTNTPKYTTCLNEVKALKEQLAIATTKFEQSQYQAEKLDRMLNKTLDAHEVTRQRLLKYENEVGVPKKASKSETYLPNWRG